MQSLLRRGGGKGVGSLWLGRRDTWQSLSAFAVEQQQQQAWQRLRERANAVQATVDRLQPPHTAAAAETLQQKQKEEEGGINWKDWEARISHKDLLDCLKRFHASQVQLLDAAAAAATTAAAGGGGEGEGKEGEERTEKKKDGGRAGKEGPHVSIQQHFDSIQKNQKSLQQQGWSIYENAVESCKRSVARSEELLANGARALWVSHRNPPVTRVDTNEWLDSDQYWQAFVERHHFYNQYEEGKADPEAAEHREAYRKAWHTRMQKFNDRSDTPMLYDYMEQLPSWEFYDIHRSAFLEHMMYFLIRTGGDYRFFPQVPPWQWVAHIEQLRYKFLSVAQRRRAELQLQNLERERPLDLLPLDIAGEGEAAVQHLLQQEKQIYQLLACRLMNHFMFCCSPFIPVQSIEALQQAVAHSQKADKGAALAGKFYTIGKDVHAVFYLPPQTQQQQQQPARPMDAFYKLQTHMQMTGRRFNPAYSELLRIHMEILEQRGEHWLTAPGECVSQAFLRRLRTDDPAYSIYLEYFEEMYSRFAAAEEITAEAAVQQLREMQPAIREEERLFRFLLLQLQQQQHAPSGGHHHHHASSSSSSSSSIEEAEEIRTAPGSPEVQAALRQGTLNIFTTDQHPPHRVTTAQAIQQSFADFQKQSDEVSELLKSTR